MIDLQKITDVARFRADVAKFAGLPLAEVVNLQDDPNEPRLQTVLMKVACEILLLMKDIDIGRSILSGEIFNVSDDTWLDPVRIAVEFIEAENAGEFVVA
jgi:hypothetical protein